MMCDWRKCFSKMFFPFARSNFLIILATLAFSLGINLFATVLLVEKAENTHYIIGFILISFFSVIAGSFLTALSGSLARFERVADSKGIEKWVDEFKKELKSHALTLIITLSGAICFGLLSLFCGIVIIIQY